MSELRKVYLPKWITWLGLAVLTPTWGWVTYRALFTASGRAEMGLVGWLLMTLFFGVFAVVLVLMGQRRLPAYLLEIGGDEEE